MNEQIKVILEAALDELEDGVLGPREEVDVATRLKIKKCLETIRDAAICAEVLGEFLASRQEASEDEELNGRQFQRRLGRLLADADVGITDEFPGWFNWVTKATID